VIDNQKSEPGAARADEATTEAENRFTTLTANDDVGSVIVHATSDPTASSLTISLSYSANVPSVFGRLVSLQSYAVGGSSAATAASPGYIDLYVLMDVSGSMGVGATAADQLLMNQTEGMTGALPPGQASGGCMFACHAEGTDTLAHQKGATLRIDAVKTALQSALAQTTNLGPATNFQVSLVAVADDAWTVTPLTSDLNGVASAVANLQLAGAHAGTAAYHALNFVNGLIAQAGDGSSSSKPLVYVLLATDGTGNSADNDGGSNANWTTSLNFYPNFTDISVGLPFPHAVPDQQNNGVMELEGLDPAWCQTLKARGIQMMTLEMPYVLPTQATVTAQTAWELNPRDEMRIPYIQQTLLPVVPGQLQACASSPGEYASVGSPTEILNGLQKLIATIISGTPRLLR
jgi:hypothetical protein